MATNADKQAALLEAERRGLLPPDKQAALDEARRRGLLEQPGAAREVSSSRAPPPGRATPEIDVAESLRASVRPSMVAVGGTAGAAVGTAGGAFLGGPPGAAAGLLGGAAAGAAGGALAFDTLNDVVDFLGMERLPGGTPLEETPFETAQARVKAASKEAGTEIMFTGGASLFFPVKGFLKPLLGKVLGVRNEGARETARLAAQQGIQLGAVDVGNVAAKGFSKVLGIFPFTGTPLRRAAATKQFQLERRVDNILNEVAPTSTLSGEVGIDLLKAAQGADARFKRIAAQFYDKFRTASRTLKGADGEPLAIIPTEGLRSSVKDFVDEFRLGQTPIGGGGDEPVQVLKGGLNEEFEKFLQETLKVPDHLTFDQFSQLQKRLEGFIDKLAPDAFTVKRVAQVKAAMENDLNNIGEGLSEGLIDPGNLAQLREIKRVGDAWFANGIVKFQTATAQKFGRADKSVFKAGRSKAGTLNPDELMKPVFNTDSAVALRDLRSLVGEDAFRQAARTHLDDAVASSFTQETRNAEKVGVFDLDKFANKLGLVDGMKNRTEALDEMLKGSGVSVRDVQNLVENARIAKISDPSTFVVRRATLGGVAGLSALGGFGVAGVGGAVLSSPTTTVALTLLSRHASRIIANPKHLKALTASFRPGLSDVAKRALLLRVARQLGGADEEPAPESLPIGP